MNRRNMTRWGVPSLLAVVCMGLGLVAQVRGATIDFSGGPTTYQPADLSDFAAGGGQSWTTPTAGTWQDQYNSGGWYGGAGPWGANLLTTNGLAGSYFKMSADLTVTSYTGSGFWYTAFSLLGSQNQAGPGGNNTPDDWYGAALEWDGSSASLDILQQTPWYGQASIASAGPQAIPSFATGTQYRLDVVGDYNTGQLTLTATLTDLSNSANTVQVSTAALSSPFADAYFGYHDEMNQLGSSGITGVIQYSNFVLTNTAAAMPEPASLGLLSVGVLGLLARRRRA